MISSKRGHLLPYYTDLFLLCACVRARAFFSECVCAYVLCLIVCMCACVRGQKKLTVRVCLRACVQKLCVRACVHLSRNHSFFLRTHYSSMHHDVGKYIFVGGGGHTEVLV